MSKAPTEVTPDRLLELLLRVARRADEVASTHEIATPLNMHCWLEAEREILGAGEDLPRTQTSEVAPVADQRPEPQ